MRHDIWRNRVSKEVEQPIAGSALPDGYSFVREDINYDEGKATVTISGDIGSGKLRFTIELTLDRSTRYPFEPPVIKVLEGKEVFGPYLVGDTPHLSVGPMREWTPSTTLFKLLSEVTTELLELHDARTSISDEEKAHLLAGILYPGVSLDDGTSRVLIVTERYVCFARATGPTDLDVICMRPLMSLSQVTLQNEATIICDFFFQPSVAMQSDLAKEATNSIHDHLRSLGRDLSITKSPGIEDSIKSTWEAIAPSLEEAKQFSQHVYGKVVTEAAKPFMSLLSSMSSRPAEEVASDYAEEMEIIKQMEAHVTNEPTITLVEEVMSLYRALAEKLSELNDPRHKDVIESLHHFLQSPLVQDVLRKEAQS